jgi:twitching motility protein PilI
MASKISLREYQRSLSARLVNQEVDHAVSKLGVQAGHGKWLIDLADAGEVMPVPHVASVPLTRTWYAGIANIRGNLYSIIDFSAFLDGIPVSAGEHARLLLIGEKYRIGSGLLVDRVLGMYRNDQLQLNAAAPRTPWATAQYTDTQGNKWKQLNTRELVAHPDFLQVGL